jgi:hypothetical protein
MRTFQLKDGEDTLTLDDMGSVWLADATIGNWTTNGQNQIVIARTAGGESAIDVGWLFNSDNHICLEQEGKTVFDFNGDEPTQPGFRVDSAVLFVKPDSERPFEISIRPAWDLTDQHGLAMTVNGKTSTIDGVISDRNSAFRFHFVDKLEVIEKFTLTFKGEWRNEPSGEDPGSVIYEYDIADSTTKGQFKLPNKLVIDNNSHVLAYNYDKNGRTRSIQLVGQFAFNQFELSYAIERKSSAEGQSTTLKFDVDVTGATSSGKLTFALKNQNGEVSSTTLTIAGTYSAKFKNGFLTMAFGFHQQTVGGTVTTRELVFGGQLEHVGGATFSWEFTMASGLASISVAADQIQLGEVTASTAVTIKMKGGQVQGVQALLGISF